MGPEERQETISSAKQGQRGGKAPLTTVCGWVACAAAHLPGFGPAQVKLRIHKRAD